MTDKLEATAVHMRIQYIYVPEIKVLLWMSKIYRCARFHRLNSNGPGLVSVSYNVKSSNFI